jgi:hypothetical protein
MAKKPAPDNPSPGVRKLMDDYHETAEDLRIAGILGIDVRTWRGWKSGEHSPPDLKLSEARHRINVHRRVEEVIAKEREASGTSYRDIPAVYKGATQTGDALDKARLQQQVQRYRKALFEVRETAAAVLALSDEGISPESHTAGTTATHRSRSRGARHR